MKMKYKLQTTYSHIIQQFCWDSNISGDLQEQENQLIGYLIPTSKTIQTWSAARHQEGGEKKPSQAKISKNHGVKWKPKIGYTEALLDKPRCFFTS